MLLAYINTLEIVPGTNQYWAISVKFLDQRNNGLSLTGLAILAILRFLVWRVNRSTTPINVDQIFIWLHVVFKTEIIKTCCMNTHLTINQLTFYYLTSHRLSIHTSLSNIFYTTWSISSKFYRNIPNSNPGSLDFT